MIAHASFFALPFQQDGVYSSDEDTATTDTDLTSDDDLHASSHHANRIRERLDQEDHDNYSDPENNEKDRHKKKKHKKKHHQNKKKRSKKSDQQQQQTESTHNHKQLSERHQQKLAQKQAAKKFLRKEQQRDQRSSSASSSSSSSQTVVLAPSSSSSSLHSRHNRSTSSLTGGRSKTDKNTTINEFTQYPTKVCLSLFFLLSFLYSLRSDSSPPSFSSFLFFYQQTTDYWDEFSSVGRPRNLGLGVYTSEEEEEEEEDDDEKHSDDGSFVRCFVSLFLRSSSILLPFLLKFLSHKLFCFPIALLFPSIDRFSFVRSSHIKCFRYLFFSSTASFFFPFLSLFHSFFCLPVHLPFLSLLSCLFAHQVGSESVSSSGSSVTPSSEESGSDEASPSHDDGQSLCPSPFSFSFSSSCLCFFPRILLSDFLPSCVLSSLCLRSPFCLFSHVRIRHGLPQRQPP
jgi:hypothetical protein